MSLRCDAVTSSGNPCRNWSVGQVNGRNYCHLASHKAQIEQGAIEPDPDPEPAPAVVEEPEAPAEPEVPAEAEVETAVEVVSEPAPPQAHEPWMDEVNAGARWRAKKKWEKEQAALAAAAVEE